MFEDTTDRDKDRLRDVRALDRRQENRVVSCLACGEVLGIYVEGGRVPAAEHDCPTEAP